MMAVAHPRDVFLDPGQHAQSMATAPRAGERTSLFAGIRRLAKIRLGEADEMVGVIGACA